MHIPGRYQCTYTPHTYIAAHTAVVKNFIGFDFDFDFMFYFTTRQARTKLKTTRYNYKN